MFFKLTRSLQPLPSPKVLFHLFDRLIKPILLYGCEIWTPVSLAFRTSANVDTPNALFFNSLKHDFPIEYKFLEKTDPIEKLHLKFCRFVLGVHHKTANLAVYGETGRFPLYIDQLVQCMKYYQHLENTENTLLKAFYHNLINNETGVRENSLVGFCESIAITGGLNIPVKAGKRSIELFKKTARSRFSNYWFKLLNNDLSKRGEGGNKLRTYCQFKSHFRPEAYLTLPQFGLRQAIARLRTSAHRLRIETDRYAGRNRYIPPDQRICTNCQLGEPETESHFMTRCTAFTIERTRLFDMVTSTNVHFVKYNDWQKFLWLMVTEDLKAIQQVAKFIQTCMALRK